MSATSRTPSLTPSRSPTPEPPLQPDHFYGAEPTPQLPLSPDSDGKTWLDPADDPLAQRGIPVFTPTMDEFQDFEGYMNRVECWGMRSGIVKIIPPKEWTDGLPSLNAQLSNVKLRNPIEQHMLGRAGLFRQENVEKRRVLSVREWAELCGKEDMRAPGVDDIGLQARAANANAAGRTRARRGKRNAKRESETAEESLFIKEEQDELEALEHVAVSHTHTPLSPPNSTRQPAPLLQEPAAADVGTTSDHALSDSRQSPVEPDETKNETEDGQQPKSKSGGRKPQTRESREAHLAERATKDQAFLETFDPHSDWLPENTTQFDYTPEFCRDLERRYWRNCGLGKPAWYGADLQGSLFTDETEAWNVGHLQSALTRLLPASSQGLPGVNTPYLYFGMWRATFAWHVEDMDLFSINYIHFGAPKFWYAVPQARAAALESTMRGYFPKDTSNCSEFLRHKSFLASPTLLSQSSCRPNTLVQREGEFVITFPRGYHAGFNLGFNCAESVNFALNSWLDLGRRAKACECVEFSVRIDVDQLIRDREAETAAEQITKPRSSRSSKSHADGKPKSSRKRKADGGENSRVKKQKMSNGETAPGEASTSKAPQFATKVPRLTLKLGPKPKEEVFPCCLCVSMSEEGLLKVQDPPFWRMNESTAEGIPRAWMAHEDCANVVPETWVDELETGEVLSDGSRAMEKVVFGVDAIVKDRWNLKCSACSKTRRKAHGAPIQCTKGKCPKAFHVSCAREGANNDIVYTVLREVEKEVVFLDSGPPADMPVIDQSAGVSPMDLDLNDMSLPNVSHMPVEPVSNVLKLIKKTEVQVLCSQHNPAVAEAKKNQKQEKIRNELLALSPMARIKLRVSAGVFEVSLLRVIEESKSVEVLWDRGIKREFKWGSVVFGSTEGLTVGQKPAEVSAEPDRSTTATPSSTTRLSFPPINSASATIDVRPTAMAYPPIVPAPVVPLASISTSTPTSAGHQYQPSQSTEYQQRATVSSYPYNPNPWNFQYPAHGNHPTYNIAGPPVQQYVYSQNTSSNYAPYPYASYGYTPAQHSQSQPRELQWQRPYTGPRHTNFNPAAGSTPQTTPYYSIPLQSSGSNTTTASNYYTPSSVPPPVAAAPSQP